MKHSIFLFAICLSLFSCNSSEVPNHQTLAQDSKKSVQMPIIEEYIQLVPDSLIYNTLDYFVYVETKDLVKSERYLDKTMFYLLSSEDSLQLLKLDTLFTPSDLEFIFKQNLNSKFFELDRYLKHKTYVSADTLLKFMGDYFWTKYRGRYGEGGFFSFWVPIFSINKEIVIIKYSFACGVLCGHGSTLIYKRRQNRWEAIICLDRWIS